VDCAGAAACHARERGRPDRLLARLGFPLARQKQGALPSFIKLTSLCNSERSPHYLEVAKTISLPKSESVLYIFYSPDLSAACEETEENERLETFRAQPETRVEFF